MVYGGRAIDDFIETVAIHIALAQAVRALAFIASGRLKNLPVFPFGARDRRRVEVPPLGQLAIPPVQRPERRSPVVAAAGDHARPLPVEIGNAGQEAVDEIVVAVISPTQVACWRGNALDGAKDAFSASIRLVVDGHQLRPSLATENGVVLWPRNDFALRHGGGARVVDGVVSSGGRAGLEEIVRSVLGARGRLAGYLGHAVAIEVVHHELRVVGAGTDVRTEIDSPHPRTVELVPIEVGRPRVSLLRIVMGVRRIPLEYDLVLAVTVEISDAGIIRGFGIAGAMRASRGRRGQADIEIAVVDDDGRRRRLAFRAVGDGFDRIGSGAAGAIQIVRGVGDHRRVELVGAPVDIEPEGGVLRVGPEEAPAQEIAAPGFHGNQTAIEFLHVSLGARGPSNRECHCERYRGSHQRLRLHTAPPL